MTDRVMTGCLGCSSRGLGISWCDGVSLSLTHSLTFCFGGLDLFCCTHGDTLFSLTPLPSSSSLPLFGTQGQGGGGGSISEVIVTAVAELRLLVSLVGLDLASICRLLRFWHTLFISKI